MALLEQLRLRLESEGRRPYVIPVGGSNALGTWGYLEAAEEIRRQELALLDSATAAAGRDEAPPGLQGERRPSERSAGFFTDIAMVSSQRGCVCLSASERPPVLLMASSRRAAAAGLRQASPWATTWPASGQGETFQSGWTAKFEMSATFSGASRETSALR